MNFNRESSTNISDFARKQLEKYGWSEGKGLGKEENGITKPVKASMKFDQQGLGHNHLDAWTSMWWCDAFNAVSKRIKVTETETGVRLKSENHKLKSNQVSCPRLAQKNFVKAGTEEENTEIFNVTANTLVPNYSSALSMKLYSMKYDKLKKSRSGLKMRHIRILKQDAEYSKKMKKCKK